MTKDRMHVSLLLAAGILAHLYLACQAQAQGFRVVYTFTGGADGANPWDSPLVHEGMLYGTTWLGGVGEQGIVYRVDIKTGQETVLHAFLGGTSDGARPDAGLIRDSSGNLYGAADMGGAFGRGALFQLQPSGAMNLYSLTTVNGQGPQATLVRDNEGNLYGSAYFYGPGGDGTILRLNPAGEISTLVAFHNVNGAGRKFGPLVLRKGQIYGTTFYGGTHNLGTIYKLDLGTGKEDVLYSFTGGADGAYPLGGLAADPAGNLYGTTSAGGAYTNSLCIGQAPGCGAVVKLDASGNLTTLYSFTGGADGSGPGGSLILDSEGNIYGSTNGGGFFNASNCDYGCGGVFEINAAGTFTALYSFKGGADGEGMFGGVALGADGILYGASPYGGIGRGTLFAINPSEIHATAMSLATGLR
jgi:uncharacterized repeat protein (TIGR03803 family)